jgi:hypothetical protein
VASIEIVESREYRRKHMAEYGLDSLRASSRPTHPRQADISMDSRAGSNGEARFALHGVHSQQLVVAIVVIISNDAKGVNPEITTSKSSSDFHGVFDRLCSRLGSSILSFFLPLTVAFTVRGMRLPIAFFTPYVRKGDICERRGLWHGHNALLVGVDDT